MQEAALGLSDFRFRDGAHDVSWFLLVQLLGTPRTGSRFRAKPWLNEARVISVYLKSTPVAATSAPAAANNKAAQPPVSDPVAGRTMRASAAAPPNRWRVRPLPSITANARGAADAASRPRQARHKSQRASTRTPNSAASSAP